jgi:hypothetical protein
MQMSHAELLRLVDEAGFIFRGRVIRQRTTGAPVTAGAAETVPVVIEEIFLSTDPLRGLTGRDVFLVSDQPEAMAEGTSFLFFTNCVAVGGQVVVRELDHIEWSSDELRQVAQLAGERPLQKRVAAADLIVTGKVIACSPVETRPVAKSEHDPDWWIARVEVQSTIKGSEGSQEIEVLFANSTDIAWYKAPKLREGDSRILILQYMEANEAPWEVGRPIYQITDPLDALPADRLPEVQRAYDRTALPSGLID